MARNITVERGRSPISVLGAVDALRNKFKIVWLQLKSKSNYISCGSNRSSEAELDPDTAAIVAELCLLICVMFPKYSRNIAIEDLVIYGMGLKIFEDVLDDIMEMRHMFWEFIDIINRREPVEKDDFQNWYAKMDADVHDLAMGTASKYPFARGKVKKSWLKTNSYKSFHGLSLVLENITEYPVNLNCPELALLRLQYGEDSQSLPIDFFVGMKELRVLSLEVPSIRQSLDVLTNLQTLHLKLLKSEDISAIGGPLNLKFLSICSLSPVDIPRQMGQLGNLRLLDLRKMKLAYFPPNVLSRMLKLEELYMPLSFIWWGCNTKEEYDHYNESESRDNKGCEGEERSDARFSGIDDGERINTSLGEISSLSLNVFHISVQKASMFPAGSPVFKRIARFKILVQNNVKYQEFGKSSMNKLQITGKACDIKEGGICDFMSRTEELSLTRVRNLKNVLSELENADFSQLKKIIISECNELKYLIDTKDKQISFSSFRELKSLHLSMLSNLKEICHGAVNTQCQWFENLRQINIRYCHKLKYVFPESMVRRLRQLQTIEILDCNEIEGVFYRNEADNAFGDLFIKQLYLHSLPKYAGFLLHKDNNIDGVDKDQLGKYEETNQLLDTNEVSHINTKNIIGEMEMCCAFSSYLMEESLDSLQKLKIAFCDAMEVIFSFSQYHAATSQMLNSLEELELYGLRNLIHIWFQIPREIICFQNLQLLVLFECGSLYLLSHQVAKLMIRLQKLQISRCNRMKEILVKEDDEVEAISDEIVFPQLKALDLQHMSDLRIFYGGISAIELPLLEVFGINQCNCGPVNTPMLGKVQINGRLYSLIGDLNATMMYAHEAEVR